MPESSRFRTPFGNQRVYLFIYLLTLFNVDSRIKIQQLADIKLEANQNRLNKKLRTLKTV